MKFRAIEKFLKDDSLVTIREATIDDAEELRIVVKEYVEESEFIPYAKDEFNLTIDEERQWIESFSEIEDGLLLVATIDDKIVGNISVNANKRKMLKHTAILGIGMLKQVRGKGLGSIFFETVIEWAKKYSGLEFLSLETYATNKAGLALYQKFGFIQVGLLTGFVKISAREYVDSTIMTLDLK